MEQTTDIPLNEDPLQPFLTQVQDRHLSQKARDETPAKREAHVDSRAPGSAQLSSSPASIEAKRGLVPTCRNSPGPGV